MAGQYACCSGITAIPGGQTAFPEPDIQLLWATSPLGAVSYGVEIGHHHRQLQDGREGDATRLQGMVKYSL
ncbi:hypothetical protein [Zobellella maritima]|uniref:hypothetical protein n=1 Tax=Zobellella maritima TaxID=2059725 RepID=UPI000E3094D5|nr:hypothetical protein [Zobellella maritima]